MTPDPPVDIRLHLTDGTIIPVEAVYIGLEEDDHGGMDVWQVTTSIPIDRLDKLTVRKLPPRTTIRLDLDGI